MSTAHVYLLELGPELSHEDVDYITYDDATQQLLVVKGGHVFAYDVSTGFTGDSSLKWMYPLQEGPPVIAMRPSLDNRMLALQRSAAMLELVDLASGMCFVHSIHKGRGDILTFFFSEAPDTDLVVVTSRAVELTQFAARRQGLRCRERIRLQSRWAVYSHETRMVLVGSASAPHSALSAWQFASHGIVHIPTFELQGLLPASAAVRQFLPPTAHGASPLAPPMPPPQAAQAAATAAGATPAAASNSSSSVLAAAAAGPAAAGADASLSAAAAAGAHRPHGSPHKNLSPEQLWLLKMYGRVYLAHVDVALSRLELYRFYTDTIILEHVLDLFLPQVQLSVVDNALVVHHPATSVAVLFDVALGQHKPLANPLPLRRLQLLPPNLAAAAAAAADSNLTAAAGSGGSTGGSSSSRQDVTAAAAAGGEQDGSFSSLSRTRAGSRRVLITVAGRRSSGAAAAAAPTVAAGSSTAAAGAAAAAAAVYESSEVHHGGSWSYFMPNIVLDRADKTVGRLQLDLQAVCDSAEDWPSLVGFLMRRRPLPPAAPLAADPRGLLMQVVRAALQERLGLGVLRAMFDTLLQAYTDAIARAAHTTPARAAVTATADQPSSTSAAAAAAVAAAAANGSGIAAGVLDVPAVSVITPNELAKELFQWLHDEEIVDALYLQAAVSEYCAAAEAAGVPPPPYLQLLTVDLLLQQEQHYQAVQLLYSQPGSGTANLARHLLEVAGKDASTAAAAAAASSSGMAGRALEESSFPAAAAIGPGSGGALGVVRPGGPFDVSSPCSAMALELALDVMTRQAVPELRPVAAAAAGSSTAAVTAGSGSNAAAGSSNAVAGGGASVTPPGSVPLSPASTGTASSRTPSQQQQQQLQQPPRKLSTAVLVRQLLSVGQVVQAARLAQSAGGIVALGIPATLFLQVAAASGDLGTLAAVYRVMGPHVVDSWPAFEAAKRALLPPHDAADSLAVGSGMMQGAAPHTGSDAGAMALLPVSAATGSW